MKSWNVPAVLLPILIIPQAWAAGDAHAWPLGLILYIFSVVGWLLLERISSETLRGSVIGATTGLFIAFLLTPVVRALAIAPAAIGDSEPGRAILTLTLYFVAIVIGAARGARLRSTPGTAIPTVSLSATGISKICDTSVLIDGRIAEMAEAGFIDGEIIIPQFVLRELQNIADSSDSLKRNRGRRGLDIVKKLQDTPGLMISIPTRDYPEEHEVDHKLIRITADLNGVMITNDFNLNKVASVRGLKVLNLNDLVNALKPIFLPGELIERTVSKVGKEPGQGIAFLDDGTMIVIDGGATQVGKKVRAVVTNIHQTTAGRMIFSRFEGMAGRGAEDPSERSS